MTKKQEYEKAVRAMANQERRRTAVKPKRDLATQRFYFLIGTLALTLVFVVASIVIWAVTPRPAASPSEATKSGIFSVKTITVLGNTRYREEAVIGESGVVPGQSIFKVDSQKVEAHLLETFPYFANVEVQTLHMNEVKITVTETDVIGVVYADGFWIPVGKNGKALQEVPIVSDRPKGRLYIKGTTPPEGGIVIGQPAINTAESAVLQTLFDAFERYELTGITEIDLTDLSDITMNWRNQITIRLGNDSNLTHEIGVVAGTIPDIVESRGEHITGVLNLISYSNDALDDMAVFTPSSLLPTTTTAPRRTEEDLASPDEEGDVTDATQTDESGNN